MDSFYLGGHTISSTHKIVLVGLGYWGVNYIGAANNLADVSIVAVVDLDESKLQEVKNKHPQLVVSSNLREAAESSGATIAIIATPAKSHFLVASQAFDLGLHVLVEKPLGLDTNETSKLLEKSESMGLTLYTGLNYMTHPCVQAVKEVAVGGVDFFHIQSQRYNFGPVRSDVSVIVDLLPHDLSIAIYSFSSFPIGGTVTGSNQYLRTGSANIEIEFENSSTLSCSLSWNYPRKVREVVFTGKGTSITFDELAPQGQELLLKEWVEAPISKDLTQLRQTKQAFVDFTKFCVEPNLVDMRNQPLAVSLKNFIDCIDAGEKTTFAAKVGHSITSVLERIEGLEPSNESKEFKL